LSDSVLLAAGCFAFVICVGVHWALYATMAPRLRQADLELRRAAILRWFQLLAAWEVLVLALAVAYFLAGRTAHPGVGAWVAPAVGAIVGNALPLQLAALAISRAAR